MVDDTENNEFEQLLSDYAAPIKDDGFSQHVMSNADLQAQTARNTAKDRAGKARHGRWGRLAGRAHCRAATGRLAAFNLWH